MAEPLVKPLMRVRARTPVFDAWQLTARNRDELTAMVSGVLSPDGTHLTFVSGKTTWVMILGDWLLHRPGHGYSEGMFLSVNQHNFEQSYLEVEHGD